VARVITCVQLDITTHCDRRCPDCCCGIGINRTLQHHPWQYFEHIAPFLQGIDRVDLFGGEPTVHPKFAEFVPRFKELFGCRLLTMTTDGCKVEQHSEILKHFDFIQATPYDARNQPAMQFLKQNVDVRFFPGVFTPRSRIGGGNPCARAYSETVAYADGKFWPCCPGPGLNGATGLEPCADWREKILEVQMPCKTCFLSS
jgi:hypothetical protein